MKQLSITQFGDEILRRKSRKLKAEDIKTTEIQELIQGMKSLLTDKKLGVGLAAPQVGHSLQLFVVELQPTEIRPDIEHKSLVIINPEVIKLSDETEDMWEGCISSGDGKAGLFAKVSRSSSVRLRYLDEKGTVQINDFDGLMAQVIQHETDHLLGKLFVDRVKDTTSYMTLKKYKQMQLGIAG